MLESINGCRIRLKCTRGRTFFFFGCNEAIGDGDHLVACDENVNKKYFLLSLQLTLISRSHSRGAFHRAGVEVETVRSSSKIQRLECRAEIQVRAEKVQSFIYISFFSSAV